MRGAERSARNTAKNISLIVLVVLMAVLCAANWLAGVSAASLDSDTLLRRAHDRLFGGAAGYEIRSSGVSAASPAQLALGAEGKLVGVQYNVTDMDTSLAAVRAIWTQALSGGALEETDEQTLADALIAERTVLLRYHGAIPFSVVSGWMGGTLKNDNISVETLFYSADSGELFVRTPEGTLYRSHAEADRGTFDRALEDFHGLDCTFAGAGGNVYPETLLFANENLTLPLLKTEALDLFDAQGGTGLASLLGAFGLSAYTDFYSEQSDAVRVFVDDASTSAVHNDRRPEHGHGLRERRGHGRGGDRRADRLRTHPARHRAPRGADRHARLALRGPEGRQPHDARVFAALRRRSRARKHGFRVVHL